MNCLILVWRSATSIFASNCWVYCYPGSNVNIQNQRIAILQWGQFFKKQINELSWKFFFKKTDLYG